MNNFTDTSLVYFKNKEEGTLEALAFYEGSHTDSQGNPHIVTPDIIKALAKKTNELLTQTDIPILTEHTKNPDNIRGVIKDVNSFIARPINESDIIRNPKLSSALGKLGLFVSNIKLTDDNLLNKIKNGVGKTISCGIDFKNSLVREISLVAVNALPLASIFNNGEKLTYLSNNINNKLNKFMENKETTAVTLEEALADDGEKEKLEAEVMQLLDVFLDVVDNISAMSDEDLGNYQVVSKEELYRSQLDNFMKMLDEKINPFGNNQEQTQQQQQYQSDPRMQQYSYPLDISTFSEMEDYINEFGFMNTMKAGLKLASKTTGIGNKLKVAGAAVGKGILGKKGLSTASSAMGTGIKTAKTAIANTASKGLNAVGTLGSKLAKNPSSGLKKIGTGLMKKSSGLADKLNNSRLGKFKRYNKLSKFIRK